MKKVLIVLYLLLMVFAKTSRAQEKSAEPSTTPKAEASSPTAEASGSPAPKQLEEEKAYQKPEEIKKELIEQTQNNPEKSFLVKGDAKFVDLEREQSRLMSDRDKMMLAKNLDKELEDRLAEMKELNNQLNKEVTKRVSVSDHLKQLVTLYESINADQATQIIKQLPTTLSVSILSLMNPKKSSKILATMDPHQAADMSRRLLKEPQKLPIGGTR